MAHATPVVDQTYGQRSVFGADGQSTVPTDVDVDCEDEQDALAYLSMVRSEASRIPHVMVAPRHGPQAFPPDLGSPALRSPPTELKAKKRRRPRRHWDEPGDDDADTERAGGAEARMAAKKRRVSRQQAAVVALSYDEEGGVEEDENDDDDDDDAESDAESEVSDDDRHSSTRLADRDLYDRGVGDARGFYHDGAYVSAPDPVSAGAVDAAGAAGEATDAPAAVDDDADFSAAFRARLLLTHFAAMRRLLCPGDGESDGESDGDASVDAESPRPTTLPPGVATAVGPLDVRSSVFRDWLQRLRTTDPLPAQLLAMDKVSVLRLLRILQRGLLAGTSTSSRSSRAGRFARALGAGGGGLDMTPRTSRWLWAIFARLPDRGELDHREVGYIRDVAKQAVMRLAHLSYDMTDADDEPQRPAEEGPEEGGAAEGEEEHRANGDGYDGYDGRDGYDGYDGPNGNGCGAEGDVEDGEVPDNDATDGHAAADAGDVPQDKEGEAGNDELDDIAMDVDSASEGAPSEDGEVIDDAMHQRATLEMVLAVAGEFYGQRDLLAFRSPWPAAKAARGSRAG